MPRTFKGLWKKAARKNSNKSYHGPVKDHKFWYPGQIPSVLVPGIYNDHSLSSEVTTVDLILPNKSKCSRHLCFLETGISRNSRPDMFLKEGVLKICSKLTGEHPCRSAISIKLLMSPITLNLQM